MAAPSPRLVDSGPVTTDPAGPTYSFFSVSNLIDRDGEYHLPFNSLLIKPGTKLEIYAPFNTIRAQCGLSPTLAKLLGSVPSNVDAMNPTGPPLAPFVLVDVASERGENMLIFARDTPPDMTTYMNPSNVDVERRTWTWPAIMKSFGQVLFDADSGNLVNVSVSPIVQRRYTGPTDFIVSQWWTARPWPENMMQPFGQGMITEEVFWNYWGLATGNIDCLHGLIRTPPFHGVTSVRGQASSQIGVQGDEFFATNTPTWIPDLEYDKPKQIRGRRFREQAVAMPPFNPFSRKQPRKWTS